MSSFVKEGLVLFYERLDELTVLLNEATLQQDLNSKLYAALCRSIQVLSVSHFEGYLKDLVKNILDDINSQSEFKRVSNDLKYTFCKNYILPLENGKDNISKLKELVQTFESLETKFDSNAFYKSNKNPKESVINNIAQNFGERKLFDKLNNSGLSDVFSNTETENIQLKDIINTKLQNSVESYPYKEDDSILSVNNSLNVIDKFWETFIQKILSERHKIAHGNMDNTISHSIIKSNILKMEIFLISITYLLSQKGNPVL